MQPQNLATRTGNALGFYYPVRVITRPGNGVRKNWAAYHILKKECHRIHIATHPERGFYPVLAHELAHAYVDEAHPEVEEIHGVHFAVAALNIQHLWAQWGLKVDGIYLPEVDE